RLPSVKKVSDRDRSLVAAAAVSIHFRFRGSNFYVLIDTAADEEFDLDASVRFPAFACRIIGNSLKFAEAIRITDPAKRYVVRFNKIIDDRLCTALAENFVLCRTAIGRSESGYFDNIAFHRCRNRSNLVKRSFCFRRKNRAVDAEIYRGGRLN